jgi:hypothetical protein
MKMLLISILILLTLRAFAPEAKRMLIEKAERIDPYKAITEGISWVESRHNSMIINYKEMAYGRWQIRQVRLDDYFRRTGIRYSLDEMLDDRKAQIVFRYYARLIGWREPEQIARKWNGGMENGMRYKQTLSYWNLVKAAI